MSELALSVETSPAERDVEALARGLTEHALPVTGRPGFHPLGVFARDREGALVGGVHGQVNWNWLHISLFWVSEDCRHQGLGSRLLAAIETAAVKRGCSQAHLPGAAVLRAPGLSALRDSGGLSTWPAAILPSQAAAALMAVTLETERLVLRMFEAADFEAYAAMCGDPEVMRFIGDGQPLAPPMAWRSLAMVIGHWSLRGYGLWAATERVARPVDVIVAFFDSRAEIGYALGRPYWGRGYATEAARAALEWGFAQLGQSQAISLIYPDNAASIRVASRLGEKLADRIELLGKPVLLYRITRDEWAKGAAACR